MDSVDVRVLQLLDRGTLAHMLRRCRRGSEGEVSGFAPVATLEEYLTPGPAAAPQPHGAVLQPGSLVQGFVVSCSRLHGARVALHRVRRWQRDRWADVVSVSVEAACSAAELDEGSAMSNRLLPVGAEVTAIVTRGEDGCVHVTMRQTFLECVAATCSMAPQSLPKLGLCNPGEGMLALGTRWGSDAAVAPVDVAARAGRDCSGSTFNSRIQLGSSNPASLMLMVPALGLPSLSDHCSLLEGLTHECGDRYDVLRGAQNRQWATERVRRGNESASEKNYGEASKFYDQALKIDPSFSDAHCAKGAALANENRLGPAVAQFEAALKLDPASENAAAYLKRTRAKLRGEAVQPPRRPTQHCDIGASASCAAAATAAATASVAAAVAAAPPPSKKLPTSKLATGLAPERLKALLRAEAVGSGGSVGDKRRRHREKKSKRDKKSRHHSKREKKHHRSKRR